MQMSLMQKIQNNNYQFIKFLFVGGLNTLFGYGIYALFLALGFDYAIAVFGGTLLSVLFNFKTTGMLVFKNKNNGLIFKFFGVYFFVYILNTLSLSVFNYFNFNLYLAGFVLLFPMALVSYYLMKKFVFGENYVSSKEKN